MKRAHTETQKKERKSQILDFASQLLKEKSPSDIVMAAVASGLELRKGTLYRYFDTKEELFLSLLERELPALFLRFKTRIEKFPKHQVNPEVFAMTLVTAIMENTHIWKLLSVLSPVLEANVGYDRLIVFKRIAIENIRLLASELLEYGMVNDLSEAVWVLNQFEVFLVGLQSLCNLPPITREIYQLEEFSMLKHDLESELVQNLLLLIKSVRKPL